MIASNVAGYVGKSIGWLMGGWLCIEIDRHSFCVDKCMKETEENYERYYSEERFREHTLKIIESL